MLPALIVGIGTCLPAAYLLLRAFEADGAGILEIVFRARNFWLLLNTLKLVALVLAIGTAIALPMAWLVTRSDLRHKKLVTFLMALPLAVPGYVMAYALLGLSGYYGFMRQWFGLSLPPLHGLWGAALSLALYTFPYIFLNLRAAFLGIDPGQEETALSLGRSPWQIFRQITLPQLWPALLASWLITGLYVIGDFGAIALMRYEVFSYAIYTQYSGAFDRSYAAWLSLMLLAITVAALLAQSALSRNRRFARTGTGSPRLPLLLPLGRRVWLARAAITLVSFAALGLPLLVLGHWMARGLPEMDWRALGEAMLSSALAGAVVAVCATLLALPVVLLTTRWPGPLAALIDRLAWLGYATPPLAFGLAMVVFSLGTFPALYQSYALLIFAWVMSFLALALGPLRLALLQLGPKQEEAARALGSSPGRAFTQVTLPQLRSPMIAAGLLVFIATVKELPIAWLLAPTGWRSLSTSVFARTVEGMMAEAAPFALTIILFSALFVGLILKYEGRSPRDSQRRAAPR
ncbi:ABC transporter permease [Pseudogemmobacter faecipullorum]|uniref:Iron ABC transporter permease n=1 Tax=Pseudogemmobacter faecipullorum TaxID=2755041 RepID=A0ABS8CKW2_9RHOB|nr:iron ABC transporter permease [Pseudogemmobacter faecipullorum]